METVIQHFSHEHHLELCTAKKEGGVVCEGCRLPILGQSYGCNGCGFYLDISCAELSQDLVHPFHPQHCLKLHAKFPPSDDACCPSCDVCGDRCSPITFCCSECDFVLDVHCASLMLMPTKSINEGEGGHRHQPNTIQHFTHPHPLIVCGFDKKTNFARTCYACDLPFEKDSVVHVCLECGLLLHDSCPDLPQVINHPFHPPHQLTLRSPFDSGPPRRVNLLEPFDFGPFMESCCRVCLKPPTRWKYGCDKCDLTIDSRCALLPYVRDTRIHHHPLVYFTNSTTGPSNFCCHVCFKIQCTPFLRCVEYNCYFEVHISCIPKLPLTLKHKYHRHALTLTNSPIKDHPDEDEDAEFYCDTCEERRALADRSYYCAECHYVAHVGCVMSEFLSLVGVKYNILAGMPEDPSWKHLLFWLKETLIKWSAAEV
ncbi:hypothetical protein HYC85_021967 [Camellia sinensis]|uniref:DC1 domain-containing protein n=1 Tax=Camellia sinensis TaxID=4442 RepID=A0A7J7GJG1_CAMSI|nr:hypothetical protein HYC85_021967 [Camellia sinensis]